MSESAQVNKGHYATKRYSNPERFASYYYQLEEVLQIKPQTILEIGVGDKVFGSFIKSNTNIKYQSLDIAEDLQPDVVGSVTKMPFDDATFDAVCAFEVLEHLPFESFETAVKEMLRVSKKSVFISLPHFGPPVKFLLKLPLLPEIKFAFKLPLSQKHVWNGQHYFEIGKRDFPLRRIIEAIKKHGTLEKEYVPFENQYHHFFVITK